MPALTHVLPPIRPLGFPIYVARRPAAPFARCFPRSFTFYVAHPSSSIVLFRSNHETFNRLALNESIHNLRDVRDRDAFVKEVIGFD